MNLLDALRSGEPVLAAELRPPRAELGMTDGLNAWIDTYHTVRSLTRQGVFVCLTDSAVGAAEEDNLRHLILNLGPDAPCDRIVPFLTAKHPLGYCLAYAERARQHGFPAVVVLGGDRHVGPARCVEHAWQLRRAIRQRVPELALGGWANPHGDPARQIDYLMEAEFAGDFFLTQIVSHHDRPALERFLNEKERRGLRLPGLYGVFFYRSPNPRTLATLRQFLPVPVEAVTAEFASGARPEDVCARTLRMLTDLGIQHSYVSNLPLATAARTLRAILDRVEVGV